MNIGTFEAIICTILFIMSGYLSYEVAARKYPRNNDELSTTKQILQYLLWSVLNMVLYLPLIVCSAKLLFPEPAISDGTNLAHQVDAVGIGLLYPVLAITYSELFFILASIVIIAIVSILTGILCGQIDKHYSKKAHALSNGLACWDKLFYGKDQMYIFFRLKSGNKIYGLWGRSPCFTDASFSPNPGIVVELCDDKFTPLGTFVWIAKENIDLMQVTGSY